MRKRIIVVSDLHIGMGRIYGGKINYKEDFIYDTDFYDFLRWWVNDSKGMEIELVLNGDIFDVIKSTHREGKVYKRDVFKFLDECIVGHKTFFEALRNFSFEGGKITYIIGNHDQAFASPDIQSVLVEKTGVGFNFIKRKYIQDGIWIEHGNIYEAINRTDVNQVWVKDKNGEEILNMPWGSRFVVEVVDSFSFDRPYLDRWRPLGKAMKWGIMFDTKITLLFLIRALKFLIKNKKFYDPKRRRFFRVPLGTLPDAMGHKIVDRSALVILRKPDVKVLVMGHTHKAMIIRKGEKIYMNSGTWIPYVSFETPQIGLVEKKTFVLIEVGANIFSDTFIWNGREKVFEELRDIVFEQ